MIPFPPLPQPPQWGFVLVHDERNFMSEKKKVIRSKVMRLRVTDEEHERYKSDAKTKGFGSVSDYFRWALGSDNLSQRATPKKEKPKRQPAVKELDQNLLREINKIGVNLNQIAHALNLAVAEDGQVEKGDLLIELVKIEQKLNKVLESHNKAQEKAGEPKR